MFHTIANKDIAARLKAELMVMMPNPNDFTELGTLESLPWLVSTKQTRIVIAK